MIKEIYKGNKIYIGKNYKELSPNEVKLLLELKCISNKNNIIHFANKSNLMKCFGYTSKKQFNSAFDGLIKKDYITNSSDELGISYTKIKLENTFEIFDFDFVYDMTKNLTPAEIKLYCTMATYLNFDKNKNYIYPSNESLVINYYEGDLNESEIKQKVYNKGLDRLKDGLIKKGYIDKLVSLRINKDKSTLGYFLNVGDLKNEVCDYTSFIKDMIKGTNFKVSTKESLIKQGYRYVDKFIYLKSENNLLDEFMRDKIEYVTYEDIKKANDEKKYNSILDELDDDFYDNSLDKKIRNSLDENIIENCKSNTSHDYEDSFFKD